MGAVSTTYVARIEDDVVVEVLVGDVSIVSDLLPGFWVSHADPSVRPGRGWTWDGTTLVPPPVIPEEEN